ncbi:hypothetical protein PAPYR_9587 [Paratrimastix pyriformis]|uniref:Uncharacterized protein n=1 Tax=Paratrimastix pyriformis TaxID=342808 RepID=A0ABQ8U7Y1_9EUKA|nr:hypothetical protein PAPYR_9587 [Paratrimastix pyriformis]
MLLTMFQWCEAQREDDEDDAAAVKRRNEMRLKVMAIGTLLRMFTTLRQEREAIIALKGFADGVIPRGLLSRGPQAIRDVAAPGGAGSPRHSGPGQVPSPPLGPRFQGTTASATASATVSTTAAATASSPFPPPAAPAAYAMRRPSSLSSLPPLGLAVGSASLPGAPTSTSGPAGGGPASASGPGTPSPPNSPTAVFRPASHGAARHPATSPGRTRTGPPSPTGTGPAGGNPTGTATATGSGNGSSPRSRPAQHHHSGVTRLPPLVGGDFAALAPGAVPSLPRPSSSGSAL